jgi:hypothetical protein
VRNAPSRRSLSLSSVRRSTSTSTPVTFPLATVIDPVTSGVRPTAVLAPMPASSSSNR